MSDYAVLRFGDFELGKIRNGVDVELLAVFNDDMLVHHTMKASAYYDWWEQDYPSPEESAQNDFDVHVVQLTAPGSTVAARLDLLGITEQEVLALLRKQFKDTEEHARDDVATDNSELSERSRRAIASAAALTAEGWMDSIRDLGVVLDQSRPYEPGSAGWNFELIEYCGSSGTSSASSSWCGPTSRCVST